VPWGRGASKRSFGAACLRCTAPVFLRRLPALPGLWLVLLAMLILTGEQGFCARSAQAAAPEQVQTQAVAQPAVAPAAQGGGVQIALEDAGLADFLRFMGQFLGSTPVFRDDQIPPAKVTIHSPGLLGPTEVRALFEIVLKTAGLETSNRGGVLYVLPAATPAERGRPRLPPDAHILARALPSSVAANALDTLTNMMERLRSDRGQVQASAAARTVVVADTAPRVAQLRPVLDAVLLLRVPLTLCVGASMWTFCPWGGKLLPWQRARSTFPSRVNPCQCLLFCLWIGATACCWLVVSRL